MFDEKYSKNCNTEKYYNLIEYVLKCDVFLCHMILQKHSNAQICCSNITGAQLLIMVIVNVVFLLNIYEETPFLFSKIFYEQEFQNNSIYEQFNASLGTNK